MTENKEPLKIFHGLMMGSTEDMSRAGGDPRHFERLVKVMEELDPEAKIAHAIAAKYQKQD